MTEKNREALAKAFIIGDDSPKRQASNAATDATESAFSAAQAIEPPYSALRLAEIFENSSTLRPNIDSYVQNIDSNGSHLEPVLDLAGDDADEIVMNAMRLERLDAIDRGQIVATVTPTEEEVAERMKQIESAMELERFRLEAFFTSCVVEESFISLRRKTRQDLEVSGNGYWEALRDSRGRIVQFVYMPAHTIRLRAQDRELVDVVIPIRQSPITVTREKLKRRFRSFVQITETQRTVFFKELGDPRVMSATTGKFYPSVLEMQSVEGEKALEATEVLHFRIHSPRSAYGVPRWIGTLPAVLGTREAEEVNLLYFENKSVPPMAVLVSGGRLGQESVDRLRDFIEVEIKGKKNFHKILVIEAEPTENSSGENTGKMRIEMKPLTQAQQQDALFLKYDERNHDKVGFSFRLPRMLRGDVRDFNRSTADAALEFAEAQVFGPERTEFDFLINRQILSTLGVRFWTFRSNSVQIRDPGKLAEIIGELTAANVLVPADARKLAAELVFNRRLPRIDADWIYQPVMLTQVGVQPDQRTDGKIPVAPNPGDGAPVEQRSAEKSYDAGRATTARLSAQARALLRLRDELAEIERAEAHEEFIASVKNDRAEVEPETISMSLAAARTLLGDGVVPA